MSLPQGGDFVDFVPIITVPISFGRVGVKWDRDNVTIFAVFFILKASLMNIAGRIPLNNYIKFPSSLQLINGRPDFANKIANLG